MALQFEFEYPQNFLEFENCFRTIGKICMGSVGASNFMPFNALNASSWFKEADARRSRDVLRFDLDLERERLRLRSRLLLRLPKTKFLNFERRKFWSENNNFEAKIKILGFSTSLISNLMVSNRNSKGFGESHFQIFEIEFWVRIENWNRISGFEVQIFEFWG